MHTRRALFVTIFLNFFAILFIATPAHAISWSTGNSLASAYDGAWITYNTSRAEFAFAYTSPGATNYNFTTSSLGTSWATARTVATHESGDLTTYPMLVTSPANGYYAAVSATSGSIWGSSLDGFTWTTSTKTGIDKNYSTPNLTMLGSNIYIGGTVSGSGLTTNTYWVTSSTNSGSTFTSSTVASETGLQQKGQITSSSDLIAGVYTTNTDTTHLYVLTSSDGITFTKTTITLSSASALYEPRIAIDSTNRIWVSYFATVSGTNYTYTSTFKLNDSQSCGVVTEQVDTEGSQTPSGLGLTIINGTTPVLAYNYSASMGVQELRTAVRDNGNSGCSGSSTKWTCAAIDSAFSGNRAVYTTSNGSGRVVIGYINGSVYKSAAGDFSTLSYAYSCPASSSSAQGQSLATLMSPIYLGSNPMSINNGEAQTSNQNLILHYNVNNASEMAISTNSGLLGSIWEPYKATKTFTLPPKKNLYTIYTKFANPTGAVSLMASSTIAYEPIVVATPPTQLPAIVAQPPAQIAPAPASPPPTPPQTIQFQQPSGGNGTGSMGGNKPFDENAFAKIMQEDAAITEQLYSCPERPNAFSIGGDVVRDEKSKKLFVVFNKLKGACPVVTSAVLASWGENKKIVTVPNIDDFHISSPLPYRPGSIIAAQKNEFYFVNTLGRIHKFPNREQLKKLGYTTKSARQDSIDALMNFVPSAPLERTDIHPDGTLFVINARAGAYALLHQRTLHPINLKTLNFYKESPARAVPLGPKEFYPTGSSWSK